jgi:putative FmdB family regulatory protein
MPLYDYKCHGCGKTFEVRQKFADEPLKVHEECGGELERLISVSALLFKGSGWYVTDYGKGNSPSKNTNGKHESKNESRSEAKSEPKADSKPAPSTASTDK